MISTHKNESTKKSVPKKDPNKEKEKRGNEGENTQSGISFRQQEINTIPGNDGRVFANITCFKCKRKGHYKTSCPGVTKSVDVNALQISALDEADSKYELVFTQLDKD